MRTIKAGATSVSIAIFIADSTSSSGAGLTGLVYNSAGLTAYYVVPGSSSAAITLATLAAANSAWSSGGFKEIDSTNMPGWYRLDLPDAVIASGRSVALHLQGATNMVPKTHEIELTGWDSYAGTVTLADSSLTTAKLGTFALAKGTNLTGFNDLDAAGVRSATGLASANLDTQLSTIAGYIDTEVGAIKTKTDQLTFTTANKIDAKLTSDGLDNIATTAPTGVASTFREMIVQTWRMFFKKTVYDASAATIKTYADNGTTVVTTQSATTTATTQTRGAAT